MSSILEALKKLEDEKTAKKNGVGEIAGKVVKSKRRDKPRPKWFYPTAMVIVASLSVLATYLVMGGLRQQKTTGEPTAAQVTQLQPETAERPAPPLKPAPVPKERSIPPRKPDVKNTPTSQPVRPVPVAGIPKPEQQPLPATPVNSEATVKTDQRPPFPQLKLTGIGWQKDSANRLAIVNGRPVSEGSTIDGAKVIEIFPDRVRFSFDNQTVDITLGKSAGEKP